MTDIVERLNDSLSAGYSELRKEAAVEIMRLRAKIAEMEQQEPARLVTATAYRWRYRGAIKWQYGELTEETVMAAKEHNHEVQPLGVLPGAQPSSSVPELIESLRCACNYIDKLGGVSQQYRAMIAAAPEAKP